MQPQKNTRRTQPLRKGLRARTQALTNAQRGTTLSGSNPMDVKRAAAKGGGLRSRIVGGPTMPKPKPRGTGLRKALERRSAGPMRVAGKRTNTTGNARDGQKFRTRVLPDGREQHVYNIDGKRVAVTLKKRAGARRKLPSKPPASGPVKAPPAGPRRRRLRT